MKDFYAENRLSITASAILENAKILENIQRGGISATSELKKSVQSSIEELCMLILNYLKTGGIYEIEKEEFGC